APTGRPASPSSRNSWRHTNGSKMKTMPREPLTLVVRHVFHADAEFLFDAWTDPSLMARWFHAKEHWTTRVVTVDARVGGAWEIVMVTGEGKDCRAFGVYRTIDRPRRLELTWHAHPGADDDYETVVAIDFVPIDRDRTELILTHAGLRDETDRSEHE